jgi:hypothetical protein
MSFHGATHFSSESDSEQVAGAAARAIRDEFASHPLKAVLVYASVTHEQALILKRLRAELGPDVPILGCSVQGVVGQGLVHEGGYLMGVMGLGGTSLHVGAAIERDIEKDTRAKGKLLGAQMIARLGRAPRRASSSTIRCATPTSTSSSPGSARWCAVPSSAAAPGNRSGRS